MLNLYYRIWVSILLRVKSTQNNFFSLIQALLVITGANLVNYIFICIFFITVFKVNIDFLYRFYSTNRYLTIILVVIVFLFPNYFFLIPKVQNQFYLLQLQEENLMKREFYLIHMGTIH